jgi:uncharacterized membrane protein YphA (DoxX/SURF4 family)
MFSTFPDGWPGVGLLLLRATAAFGLIGQGIAYIGDQHDRGALIAVAAALMIGFGALLLIGSLTRFAAVAGGIASAASLFSWFPTPRIGIFQTDITAVLAIVIVAALMCLGSGAFSVDARLFGRREVIIPGKFLSDE